MADKENSEVRMNLVAVKKADPYAKDIIDTSSHVAFYTFNSEGSEWEKTNVEGAFFVYSRNAEPYHSIFVNNRLNTNSLVEPITADIEIQSQPPFLLYRNERTRIRGFWFYNLAECDRIAELVVKLVENCKKDKTMENYKNNKPVYNSVDIFSMLSKAQEDFNKSGAGGGGNISLSGSGAGSNHGSMQQSQHSIGINFSSNKSSDVLTNNNGNQPDVTSSVMNFFAAAKPNPPEVPIFQRMLSNPVVSVEQIEKQQRASSPTHMQHSEISHHMIGTSPPSSLPTNLNKSNNIPTLQPSFTGTKHIENGLRFARINSPSQQQHELGTSPLATFLSSSNLPMNMNDRQSNHIQHIAQDVSDIESRQKQPLHQLLRKTNENILTSNASVLSSPGKPALLLPNMFASQASTLTSSNMGNISLIKNFNNNQGTQMIPLNINPMSHTSSSHISPNTSILSNSNPISLMSVNSNPQSNSNFLLNNHQVLNNNNNNNNTKPEPLTQSQLLQAMNYLIKNDPDFIKKLHEAYLKSFTEMVSL